MSRARVLHARWTRIAVIALLLASVGAPARGSSGSRGESVEDRVEQLFSAEFPADRRVDELVALGPSAVPAVLARLSAGSVPGSGTQRGDELRSVALSALARLPLDAVRHALEDRLEEGLDRSKQLIFLELLGHVGSRNELGLLCDIAAHQDADRVPADLRRSFGAALNELIARDPDAPASWVHSLSFVPPALSSRLAASLENAHADAALELLLEMMHRTEHLHATLLREVRELLARHPDLATNPVRREFRKFLLLEDTNALAEAVALVGRLRDGAAVPELIEFLSHEDVSLRGLAHSSLQAITRVSFANHPTPWRDWWERELAWWERSGANALQSLHFEPVPAAAKALLELADHGAFRHEFAPDVALAISRREREIVSLGCSVALQLSLVQVLPAVSERLREVEPDAELRAVLERTLRELSAGASIEPTPRGAGPL